jgi:hypothetical protein
VPFSAEPPRECVAYPEPKGDPIIDIRCRVQQNDQKNIVAVIVAMAIVVLLLAVFKCSALSAPDLSTADRDEYREAAGVIAEAAIRSMELIVQADVAMVANPLDGKCRHDDTTSEEVCDADD